MPQTDRHDIPLRDGRFTAYDHGAQLGGWEHHGQPVLYLSSLAATGAGAAIRGGVPLCWPWFGPGRDGRHTPGHGFGRVADWRLVDRQEDPAGARLTWELTPEQVADLPGRELWPHDFLARCEVSVGDAARVALTVTNTGSQPFDYEVALHSYLVVGDVGQIVLTGLDGSTWFDKVVGGVHRQDGDLRLDGETDRIYHTAGPVEVHDPVLGRTLRVTGEGTTDTIVWNPGSEKGQDIGDMAPDDWRTMVCVESGAVADNAISLPPGARWTTATTITMSTPMRGTR